MRKIAVACMIVAFGLSSGATAGTFDVREVARLNNCTPQKIDVFQQTLGQNGKTVYKVDCTIAQKSDAKASAGANALLIECTGSMCSLLRAVAPDTK